MQRNWPNRLLFTLVIALLTIAWCGSVYGFPPGWAGFHASTKGFPGWSEYDKDRQDLMQTEELRVIGQPVQPGYNGGPNGEGGRGGHHPPMDNAK